jgi:hypothetical protein
MSRAARDSLVIWIDERCVGAAMIAPGDRPRINKAVDLPVSPEQLGWMVDPVRAAQLGQSLRQAMKNAGVHPRGGRALAVVSRQCVVLKRLRFDGVIDVERDLPGMVRLQLVRQLALPLEGGAIDYALHQDSGPEPRDSVSVIAAAMIGQRFDGIRAMVKAAGLKLTCLGVSPSGLAALASPTLANAVGPVLAIVPTINGADYLIVDEGRLTFARTVELTLPGGSSATSEPSEPQQPSPLSIGLLATEAKRTWVSERLTASTEPVSVAMALVPAWVSQEERQKLADHCAAELGMPCTPASLGDLVEVADGAVDEPLPSWLFAAAGVVQGWHLKLEAIDLLRVRKPPDTNAKWRKLAMAAALMIVAGAGAAYTMLSAQLRDLQMQKQQIAERIGPLQEQLSGAMQTQIILGHLQRWAQTEPDWLGHLDTITSTLPARESFVMTDLTLSGSARVSYEPGKGKQLVYNPKAWQSRASLDATIHGRAATTSVADAWRGRLVSDAFYSVAPLGRDMPPSGDQRYPVPVSLRLLAGDASAPGAQPEQADGENKTAARRGRSTGPSATQTADAGGGEP